MDVRLEREQVDLLTTIVERHRSVPREKRDRFYVVNSLAGSSAIYPKMQDNWQLPIVQSDLEVLASYGFISASYGDRGLIGGFSVRPEGIAAYEQLKQQAGEPAEQVESEVRRFLDSDEFAARYPVAYAKWRSAEGPLWASDGSDALTAIGHHAREAMQAFATELVARYEPAGVDGDPAHDVARIRAVLVLARDRTGESERAFLDALIAYWGTVTDLAQRQEHGSQREGEALSWEDARRLVFQTLVVMFEVARVVRRALG